MTPPSFLLSLSLSLSLYNLSMDCICGAVVIDLLHNTSVVTKIFHDLPLQQLRHIFMLYALCSRPLTTQTHTHTQVVDGTWCPMPRPVHLVRWASTRRATHGTQQFARVQARSMGPASGKPSVAKVRTQIPQKLFSYFFCALCCCSCSILWRLNNGVCGAAVCCVVLLGQQNNKTRVGDSMERRRLSQRKHPVLPVRDQGRSDQCQPFLVDVYWQCLWFCTMH